MKKEIIKSLASNFNAHSNFTENNIEFWFARDLQHLLGYTKWDNFLNVISKAKTACETSGHLIEDHFADVGKMVKIGSRTEREIVPKELPPEEDIKKIERCVKSENKKFIKKPDKLKNKK